MRKVPFFLLFILTLSSFAVTAQTVATKDHREVADQLLEVGQIVSGRYEESKLAPRRMTAEERAEYNFRRGYVFFGYGEHEPARRMFELIDQRSDYYSHAQYYRGYMDYVDSLYVDAKAVFQNLTKDETYGKLAPYYLLQIEFALGNYDYVAANAEKLIENTEGPRRVELSRMAAQAWFRLGDHGNAIESMRAYRTEGGTETRTDTYMTGFSLYREGRWEEAADYLARVVGADDSLSQNASYHLADAYLKMGDRVKAAQSFSIAATSGHDATITEDALLNYGKLLYETGGGRFNESVNVLERYLADYPDSKAQGEVRGMLQRSIYQHALDVWKEGDGQTARELLAQSTVYPQDARLAGLARFWEGEILYSEGKVPEARVVYEDFVRRASISEREALLARYNLGYIEFNNRQWNEAQRWFDDFLARYHTNDVYRADALNRVGDIRQAGREYWRAIENYDLAARAARAVGAAANDEAVYAAYKRAIMLGLVDREADKVDGLLHIVGTSTGRYAEAAMYELGRTYITQENYSQGANVLRDFVARFPDSEYYMSALTSLGLAYLNMGNRAESKRYYELAVTHGKDTPQARDAMAGLRGIYVEEGDVDGYVDWAGRIGAEQISAAQRDSLSFAAAERVYLSGDGERAVTALEGYVADNPGGRWIGTATGYLNALYPKVKFARAQGLSGEAAMAIYRELAQNVKSSEGSRSAFIVAEDLFNRGDLEGAEAAVLAFSESGTVGNTYWLGKAFLLLGDIYVQRGDTFQARATFQSILDGYSPKDDGVVAEARNKIAALK